MNDPQLGTVGTIICCHPVFGNDYIRKSCIPLFTPYAINYFENHKIMTNTVIRLNPKRNTTTVSLRLWSNLLKLTFFLYSAGTRVIAMVEAIVGNVNHIRKS